MAPLSLSLNVALQDSAISNLEEWEGRAAQDSDRNPQSSCHAVDKPHASVMVRRPAPHLNLSAPRPLLRSAFESPEPAHVVCPPSSRLAACPHAHCHILTHACTLAGRLSGCSRSKIEDCAGGGSPPSTHTLTRARTHAHTRTTTHAPRTCTHTHAHAHAHAYEHECEQKYMTKSMRAHAFAHTRAHLGPTPLSLPRSHVPCLPALDWPH